VEGCYVYGLDNFHTFLSETRTWQNQKPAPRMRPLHSISRRTTDPTTMLFRLA